MDRRNQQFAPYKNIKFTEHALIFQIPPDGGCSLHAIMFCMYLNNFESEELQPQNLDECKKVFYELGLKTIEKFQSEEIWNNTTCLDTGEKLQNIMEQSEFINELDILRRIVDGEVLTLDINFVMIIVKQFLPPDALFFFNSNDNGLFIINNNNHFNVMVSRKWGDVFLKMVDTNINFKRFVLNISEYFKEDVLFKIANDSTEILTKDDKTRIIIKNNMEKITKLKTLILSMNDTINEMENEMILLFQEYVN